MTHVSHQRSIRLRKRADLVVVPVDRDSLDLTYVVKDPLALRYYRLRPDEYFIFERLDGQVSLESLRADYLAEFAPERVSLSDIEGLLYRLHQLGLVLSDRDGQGEALLDRGTQELRREWLGRLVNFLFVRFPGVDPEPFLNACYPWVRRCFSPSFLILAAGLMVWAAAIVVLNWRTLMADTPSLEELFSAQNVLVLMSVVSVTKILHELGHGFACKHFGGECHEIGPMLLVMTPALYCDTSDSWLLPYRLHRAAVGAAGMYVELVLATIATFVWWWTEPGLVHYVSVRVMFVCSVSTVVFNANPLLRYDGYYILSDLCRVPNLAQESNDYLLALLRRLVLGVQEPRRLLLAHPVFLAGYSVASTCYRWFVMLSIVYFLSIMLRPLQLHELGHCLTIVAVVGMLVMPTKQAYKYLESPQKRGQIKRGRVLISVLVTTVMASIVLFTPLPHRIYGEAKHVNVHESMYVTSPGFITESLVQGGELVQQGDLLLRLGNDDLEQHVTSLDLLRTQHRLTVESLESLQIQYPELASQLPAAQSAWDDAKRQHERAVERRNSLLIKAAHTGVFVEPANRKPMRSHRALNTWSGFPTDACNIGAWLTAGTEIGSIRSTQQTLIELVIEQADIPFVQVGQPVRCWMRGYQRQMIRGTVIEISKRDVEAIPDSLAAEYGGGVPVDRAANEAGTKPRTASYFARVQIDFARNQPFELLSGTRGRGRIDVGKRSLAQRIGRKLAQLLRPI